MILVTGASGMVGSVLVQKLLEENKTVRVFCRHPDKSKDPNFPQNVDKIHGSILEPKALDRAMDGVESVIHLVGILFESKDQTFERVHSEGTKLIIEAALRSGVNRIIYLSALGTRPNASSRYHQTKWRAEEHLHQSQMDFTIFRPSVIFGPFDDFTNQFARIARLSPVLPLFGDGQAKMQPVGVEDVVNCLLFALENPDTIGKTYELGGAEVMSFQEIINEILLATDMKRLTVPIPFALLNMNAWMLEKIVPHPPFTVDQLLMAKEDNICKPPTPWEYFGIQPKGFREGIREFI
jgi:uncharacterized protein YbjT (DUF2867 family)